MLCIDLCSGLGGFSEAFLDRGHEVIRIDNDEKFHDVPFTYIHDVREIPLEKNLTLKKFTPDILLMSPPCKHFSMASKHLHWDKNIPKSWETVQALRIVFWCLDAVDYLKPKYWVLENPRGKLRFILGKPEVETYFGSWGSLLYKPTDLWGKIPPRVVWRKPDASEFKGSCSGKYGGKDKRSSKSNLRAKIPYKLSEALCLAMEKELRGGD